MKDIILFRSINCGVKDYASIISDMIYKDNIYGSEIPDFNQYDSDFDKFISTSLGEDLRSTKNSGLFRKPYGDIHFEMFDHNLKYIFALVMSDMDFKTYKYIDGGYNSAIDMDNNIESFDMESCKDISKWEETAIIKLKAGDGICFRPWLWHSMSESLLQIFYVEDNNGH